MDEPGGPALGRDALVVAALVLAGAVVGEGLNYLFIFRTDKFKRLQADVGKMKKLHAELAKEAAASGNKKKKEARLTKTIEMNDILLQKYKFQAGLVSTGMMLGMIQLLAQMYTGVVVARLPFTPPAFVQRHVTHRGLEGDDPRECSHFFIYMLCAMTFKPMVQKLLGVGDVDMKMPAWVETTLNKIE